MSSSSLDYSPITPPMSRVLVGPDTQQEPLNSPKTPSKSSLLLETPSPLLLATDVATNPLRDEESALFSDSDGASQASGALARRSKKRSSSHRRRKSDVSEARSGRSTRSNGAQRISRTTKIFRNLLILEESLRQQSRAQRALRRKFTAFIAVLAGLEGFSVYSLYFVIVPPSPVVKISLQLLMVFILVTLVLYHLSGEYNRTIVIPRKFFNSTNKGLRQLNLKLVKVKSPISDHFVDFWRAVLRSVVWLIVTSFKYLGFLLKIGILKNIYDKLKEIEMRAQPRIGVTDVKLVLNPRSFNSEIRESWELYRDEFWVKEASKNNDIYQVTTSPNVLNKARLMERHRKERKDRRRSKLPEDIMYGSGETLRSKSISPPAAKYP